MRTHQDKKKTKIKLFRKCSFIGILNYLCKQNKFINFTGLDRI